MIVSYSCTFAGLTPAAMQQRILEELTTTRWDDSPPILPSNSPIVVHDSDSEPDVQSPFHATQSVVHTATMSGIEPGPSSNHSVVTTSEPCSQPVYIIGTGRFVRASSSEAAGEIQQPLCDGESVLNEITATTEGAPSTPATEGAPSSPATEGALSTPVSAVKPSSCNVAEQRVEDTSYAISVHVENAGELDLSVGSSRSNPIRDSSTEDLRAGEFEDRMNEKERVKARRKRSGRETRKDHSGSGVRTHPDSDSEHEHSRRRRHHGRSEQHRYGHSSYSRHRLKSFSSDDSCDHLRRERRRRGSEREQRYDDAESSRARRDYQSSHREAYYGDHDYDRFTDSFPMSSSYYQRDQHHHRSRLYSDDYPHHSTDATSHREHVHRDKHHSSSDHSDGEHGSFRRRKYHQRQRSSSSSWEKERNRLKTRRHSRERKHHRRSKHKRKNASLVGTAQDAVVVQLSDELNQLDEQIRDNKKQLLKSLLHRERLELLHKALHSETASGDAPESETREATPQCIVEPVRIASHTPTKEMLKELTFLDQAIKDGKRQILRVMKRMEEQEVEEHRMDSS